MKKICFNENPINYPKSTIKGKFNRKFCNNSRIICGVKKLDLSYFPQVLQFEDNSYMTYDDIVDLGLGLINLIIRETENRVREEFSETILSLERKLKDIHK